MVWLIITFIILLTAFCFTSEFAPWREALVEMFVPLSEEEKENKKSEEGRAKILNQYYREFLAYGYEPDAAKSFAIKKLKKEADAASGLSKEELR